MRLHRIRLEHVRGLSAAEVRFAAGGVTIVEAPNESGKTTLFDAFDVLLREKHTTTKQAVKDLQPVGRDVGSLVEAELTVGETHLTVRKRFNRDRLTELVVHTPTPRQLAGHEGHDELCRILEEETDLTLYEALRFQQGRALDTLELAGSEQLARRLDASAGGSGDLTDDALYTRVVATFERYFTPTGQDGRELREADASLAEAEQDAADLSATALELEAAAQRATELSYEQRRLNEALAELAPRLDQHRAQVKRLSEARSEVESAASRLRAARSERDVAGSAVRERDELVAAVARLEERLQVRQSAASEAETVWRRQRDRLEGLALVLREREHEEAEARARVQAARAGAELDRRREELRVAHDRRRRINEALDQAREADAFLVDHPLTSAQLAAIRHAADDLQLAEARLDDAAPTVQVRAHGPLDLKVDGESTAVEEGGSFERQVPDRLVIELDAVMAVDVRAGSSLAERQAERDAARERLGQACSVVQVADREDAEKRARERDACGRVLGERDAVIARELGGATRQDLDDQIRRLETQITDLETRVVPDRSRLPFVSGDAPQRLRAAETAEDEARTTAGAARADHQALAVEVARLRDVATAAASAATHDGEELRSLRDRLEDARRRVGDAALAAALTRAEEERTRAERRSDALERDLEAMQPDDVELLADNAERLRDRLTAELADVREQTAAVWTRIEVRGGEGIGEALQAATAEFERRSEERRSLRARAAAAKTLRETFESAREATYAAYREPLRERIVRAGRLVFGEELEVELDEQLGIVRRTLGGITLEFAQLSAGAREQLAILTALAAADLAGDDGVPLVLDDTLGYTDAARLERIGAVLGRVRGPQVIVLTCVGDRFRAIGGAEVVRLRESVPS